MGYSGIPSIYGNLNRENNDKPWDLEFFPKVLNQKFKNHGQIQVQEFSLY